MQIDLTRGDIARHIRTLAVPACIGFFFHTMFNVTDTYFAGTISTRALAALSLSFPIFFIIISVAGGMAEAVTAAVGNALGRGEKAAAQHTARNALFFGAILAAVLTAAGYAAAPALMRALGADGTYLDEALGYINVIIGGTALFVFAFFINAILNALGDTVSFRNILVVSAFVNVLLDRWFVKGGLGLPALGMEGIALATVMIEALTVAYLWYRLRRTPLLSGMHAFRADTAVLKALVQQGLPPSTNMALMAVGIYLITYFAAPFGKEVVAAYGIGMRVEQIVLMPSVGLNVAVLTIVARNNGAGNYGRIAETLKHSLFYGGIVALIGGIFLLLGAERLMGFFSDSPRVVAEGAVYLRIEALILYPFAMIFIYLAMLQGIRKPAFIFYISLARQVIAPLLLLSLLAWMGLGATAIWIGIASIVAAAALVTRWYAQTALERHGL